MSDGFEERAVKQMTVFVNTNLPITVTADYTYINGETHHEDITGETIEVKIEPNGLSTFSFQNARKRFFQFKPPEEYETPATIQSLISREGEEDE